MLNAHNPLAVEVSGFLFGNWWQSSLAHATGVELIGEEDRDPNEDERSGNPLNHGCTQRLVVAGITDRRN